VIALAATFAVAQGDVEAAQTSIVGALELESVLVQDMQQYVGLHYGRAWLAQRLGDVPAARALLERGAALGEQAGAGIAQAMCLWLLARLELADNNVVGARRGATEALEVAEKFGFLQGQGMALLTLGMASMQKGDLAAAREAFEASLAFGRE